MTRLRPSIFVNATDKTFHAIPVSDVSLKVLRSFTQQFKNTPEPQWYTLKNDFVAEFEKCGQKTKAVFAKNGYVYYTITYTTEKTYRLTSGNW
ncbi:MAG: hypothetical protein ICV79_25575 [Flavisolibacter sp.]|nr:hypothetical protein [Flavisolibacter sp.]